MPWARPYSRSNARPPAVRVAGEHVLPPIPSLRHVMRTTRYDHPGQSRHAHYTYPHRNTASTKNLVSVPGFPQKPG